MEEFYYDVQDRMCITQCPYYKERKIGSHACQKCVYNRDYDTNWQRVGCNYKAFEDEYKEKNCNSWGNRLKVSFRNGKEIGYIDGYLSHNGKIYAIVCIPKNKKLDYIPLSEIKVTE